MFRRLASEIAGSWRQPFLGLVAALSIIASTDFHAPPRFDGAGYSILAESIMTGQGYREIEHPDAPVHGHFPPGYPLVLAGLWSLTGRSALAAHSLSAAFTIGAVVLASCWYRKVESSRISFALGLALAINWSWGRVGASIQSEPLFLLIGQATLLIAARPGMSIGRACVLGLLLGAATLVRHVGVCLVAAVVIDTLWKGRRREAWVVAGVAILVVAPWLFWLATSPAPSQASLLQKSGLLARVADQGLFYLQRWPDQFVGPVVEIATVFGRSPLMATLATFFAAIFTTVLIAGWVLSLRTPAKRLAGLIPLVTLGLLLIWPFTEAGRFLIPLVPLGLFGLVEGAEAFPKRFGKFAMKPLAASLICFASFPYPIYALVGGRISAQHHSHDDFDAACRWIGTEGRISGPILARHPGETYWLSGRKSVAVSGDDPLGVDKAIDRYGVAYLVVDDDRYANAAPSVLGRFAVAFPDRVSLVLEGSTKVYAVVRPVDARPGGDAPAR